MTKKIYHERDKHVHFEEKSHIYTIRGDSNYTSGTQFIHKHFPKFDEDAIINTYYDRWQKNPNHKYHGMSIPEIKSMWNKNKLKSSQYGTDVHKLCELYLLGEEISSSDAQFEEFLRLLNTYPKKLNVFAPEWIIYDEDNKIAGTMDALFKDENGDYILVDFKTNKSIDKKAFNPADRGLYPVNHLEHCNFIHYCLQLSLYRYILKKNYDIEVKRCEIWHLREGEIIECPYYEEEIVKMLSLHTPKTD